MESTTQHTTTTRTPPPILIHHDHHASSSEDEILKSPFSRVYIRPETEQIINIALGFKHPIDIPALKHHVSTSLLLQHPRFTSLLIKPSGHGRERWRKTKVNLDDHFFTHHHHQSSDELTKMSIQEEEERESTAVGCYLSQVAVSTPLSREKPLWEVHVFTGLLNFAVWRVHHGIGDGVSLMSMLAVCFGSNNQDDEQQIGSGRNKKKKWRRRGRGKGLNCWEMVKSVGWTVGFVAKAAGRSLWVKDEYGKMGLSVGGGGNREKVEVRPKVVVTAKFKLDDMKSVKRHVPNATTNDVLLGVISSGLSKYLKLHSPQDLPDGQQITGVLMVNMRKTPGLLKPENVMISSGGGWGNKVGVFIVPLHYYTSLHPLQHVRKAKSVMDKKKRSFEAQIVDKYNSIATYFCGPKVLTSSYRRVARNTTFMLSNIMGPQQEISIAGNPVTYIKVSTSSLPTVITMHLVTYMGKAHLQVMVPKDTIQHPSFLAKCFEDSLLEMITAPPLNSA